MSNYYIVTVIYNIYMQVLIKFKNFFYFEEKDEPVEEFDKVCTVI